jgi:type I restriction enzyme M protein
LAARWGGDAIVQELIEAGHLKPDGGRVLRTKTSVDAASLWEVLPEDGSTIGNQRARSELGWKSVRRFEAAKTLLVATGEIALGRGRGSSIRRKLEIASTPDVPTTASLTR